ncbi:MAG: alpha/beta hydrolase [Microbacteriaceae bacterium]
MLPLLIAALAGLLGLTGCAAVVPVQPSVTSVPRPEKVAAGLQPFYGQVLHWTACRKTFQCATAQAPMDWTHPATASIRLALIRKPASGTRLGSLLVNPGGPGASGYDFIANNLDYAVDSTLRQHYDIVGFDPRGVGRSSAVSCYTRPAEMDTFLYGIPVSPFGTPQYVNELNGQAAAFAQACLKNTGPLLGFVDTVSAARDLDLLRAILGDKKLNYLGYSYGTYLGATYAGLFPQNTGRLVLDGAVDPTVSDFEVLKAQAVGFESALHAYLKDCLTRSSCPFRGTVDQASAAIGRLMTQVSQHPIRATDGRLLGSSTLFYAIILPLYSKSEWKYLDTLFASVGAGSADYAFRLADSYNDRKPGGGYASNSTEAFIAINCLDYRPVTDFQTLQSQAAILTAAAPIMGKAMSFSPSCSGWPFPAARAHVAITAAGSAPILVVGTTNDPATPYAWAQNLAKQLQNGHLLTFHGEGHTAYNKSNSCVNTAVDAFFVTGTVPVRDPQC